MASVVVSCDRDEGFLGVHGFHRDEHAVEDEMGVSAQEDLVLGARRLALGSVRDDDCTAAAGRDRGELRRGRESGAPAAGQAAFCDDGTDRLRPSGQVRQRSVTLDVAGPAARAGGKQPPHRCREESQTARADDLALHCGRGAHCRSSARRGTGRRSSRFGPLARSPSRQPTSARTAPTHPAAIA